MTTRLPAAINALLRAVADPKERLSYRRFVLVLAVLGTSYALVWGRLLASDEWLKQMLWLTGLYLGAGTTEKILTHPRPRSGAAADEDLDVTASGVG